MKQSIVLTLLQYLVEAHQDQQLDPQLYSVRETYLCIAYLEDILVGLEG